MANRDSRGSSPSSGDIAEDRVLLGKALAIDPEQELALSDLGTLEQAAGHWEAKNARSPLMAYARAAPYFQHALRLRPDEANFLASLAHLDADIAEWKLDHGQPASADIAAGLKSSQLAGKDARAEWATARLLACRARSGANADDRPHAQAALQRALALDPHLARKTAPLAAELARTRNQ